MTREELEAALEGHFPESWGPFEANDIIHAAARTQLALMPEKCGTCEGAGRIFDGGTHAEWGTCPICHGSGKVYPPETIEKIKPAIREATSTLDRFGSALGESYIDAIAVAVLDALGEI